MKCDYKKKNARFGLERQKMTNSRGCKLIRASESRQEEKKASSSLLPEEKRWDGLVDKCVLCQRLAKESKREGERNGCQAHKRRHDKECAITDRLSKCGRQKSVGKELSLECPECRGQPNTCCSFKQERTAMEFEQDSKSDEQNKWDAKAKVLTQTTNIFAVNINRTDKHVFCKKVFDCLTRMTTLSDIFCAFKCQRNK
jgi:hypothetical protein